MARTLEDALNEMHRLSHLIAVWEQVVDHLYDYVPDEAGADEPKTMFAGMFGDGSDPVSVDTIQAIIGFIETEHIDPIKEKISGLKSLEIADEEKEDEGSAEGEGDSQKGNGAQQGQGSGKADLAGRNERGKQKNPRKVQLRRGRKAQANGG